MDLDEESAVDDKQPPSLLLVEDRCLFVECEVDDDVVAAAAVAFVVCLVNVALVLQCCD